MDEAFIPANIVSGFRKCGIYPFNGNAIPVSSDSPESVSPVNENTTPMDTAPASSVPPVDESSASMDTSDADTSMDISFTEDQIRSFTNRYKEGFDVYEDPQYVLWLKLNHPEAVPGDDLFNFEGTFSDEFSFVPPLDPIQVCDPSKNSAGRHTGARNSTAPQASPAGNVSRQHHEPSSPKQVQTTPQESLPSSSSGCARPTLPATPRSQEKGPVSTPLRSPLQVISNVSPITTPSQGSRALRK